jgi:hypothetical protein
MGDFERIVNVAHHALLILPKPGENVKKGLWILPQKNTGNGAGDLPWR